MSKHVPSKATYILSISHQFTVRQVGKGGKIVIGIDHVITHHTKFNPEYMFLQR